MRGNLANPRGTTGHGIVSRILLLPHFRQPTAPLNCEKESLRWPGPFGSGFLSPQPPGAVGIGPVAGDLHPETGANASWSFFFLGFVFQSGCLRKTPVGLPHRPGYFSSSAGMRSMTGVSLIRQSARRLGNDLDRALRCAAQAVTFAVSFKAEARQLPREAFDLIAHTKQPQARTLAGSHQKIRSASRSTSARIYGESASRVE